MNTIPQGKANLRLKKSMASPAMREPVSMPREWAIVITDMTDPMACFSSPLITARAVMAGMEIPPPIPNRVTAARRS